MPVYAAVRWNAVSNHEYLPLRRHYALSIRRLYSVGARDAPVCMGHGASTTAVSLSVPLLSRVEFWWIRRLNVILVVHFVYLFRLEMQSFCGLVIHKSSSRSSHLVINLPIIILLFNMLLMKIYRFSVYCTKYHMFCPLLLLCIICRFRCLCQRNFLIQTQVFPFEKEHEWNTGG